jgi:hypothetical protein
LIALGISKLVCKQPIYWALTEEFINERSASRGNTRRPKQELQEPPTTGRPSR